MKIHFVLLWTDLLIYILFATIAVFTIWTSTIPHWRETWQRIARRKLAMISLILLLAYSLVALLDSIHFKISSHKIGDSHSVSHQVQSLLDILLLPLGRQDEDTYSAPFSLYSSARMTTFVNNKSVSYYPRLLYGGRYLASPSDHIKDITNKVSLALMWGLGISLIFTMLSSYVIARHRKMSFKDGLNAIISGRLSIAWREILLTCCFIIVVICFIKMVSPYYHILGTNKIGGDTLYETIKSIRTGLVIGTLTTLVMLPFAIMLGTEAGYFGGWRDDIIQYVYTTLSSIPGVLLITASVLSLQIFISNHPEFFPTLESRADARLLALCFILGITSWTSLCRLLRAETLKLREMDYVKVAVAMGVYNFKIIWRHIVPNVMHIILITIVLDFSGLVLAEAVLSYVGVGVDPITQSWGNMINSARLDLAREPVVWWPLFAAFIFMFLLVLAANLYADAVRDAFDPRLRNEL